MIDLKSKIIFSITTIYIFIDIFINNITFKSSENLTILL